MGILSGSGTIFVTVGYGLVGQEGCFSNN